MAAASMSALQVPSGRKLARTTMRNCESQQDVLVSSWLANGAHGVLGFRGGEQSGSSIRAGKPETVLRNSRRPLVTAVVAPRFGGKVENGAKFVAIAGAASPSYLSLEQIRRGNRTALRASSDEIAADVKNLRSDAESIADELVADMADSSAQVVEQVKTGVASLGRSLSDAQGDVQKYAHEAAGTVLETGADAAQQLTEEVAPEYASWNSTTEKLTLASSFAGLFLMAPQIAKNAELLGAGQAAAVGILPWVGYSTGFLGNMLLLSYFASKRELSATLVQAIGATSTSVLLFQIYLAGYMPPPAFAAVASFLGVGLVVNALQYSRKVPRSLWAIWEDLLGVLGLAVLPQVICQTFFPGLQTPLPGALAAVGAASFVVLLRLGKVPEEARVRWAKLSGWTATLLFMFMPVAQLKECFARPESLAGISPLGPIMGVVSNGLMVPRALFTRDLMWFTGATWGALMMGWGVLLSMVLSGAIGQPLFATVTVLLLSYFAAVFTKDSHAHSLSSGLASLQSLLKRGL